MSEHNTHTYRVCLSPMGSWHFSNPRSSNLGNQSDYFHGSRIFPTQTALFGTLRRALGIASGLLKANESGVVENQALEKLIGPLDWQEHTGSFGQIEGISPVLIAAGKTDYVYRPFEGIEPTDEKDERLWSFPKKDNNDLGTVTYPLHRKAEPQKVLTLHNVDAKTYFEPCLVPTTASGQLDESKAISVSKAITTFKKEHVNTIQRDKSDLEGFYIMERKRFSDSAFMFVTYLTTNQALSEGAIAALNRFTVPLHGGDNQFNLSIETASSPAWLSTEPGSAKEGDRLLALSPVKVFESYAQKLLRAHSKRYAHRVIVRKANTELYAKPVLSEINFWADKGSVFWPSTENEADDWPATPKALERQGFGYFYHLPTSA